MDSDRLLNILKINISSKAKWSIEIYGYAEHLSYISNDEFVIPKKMKMRNVSGNSRYLE